MMVIAVSCMLSSMQAVQAIEPGWEPIQAIDAFEPPEIRFDWENISVSVSATAALGANAPEIDRRTSARLSGRLAIDTATPEQILAVRHEARITELVPRGGEAVTLEPEERRHEQTWREPRLVQLHHLHHRQPEVTREHIRAILPSEDLPSAFDRIAGHIEILLARDSEIKRFALDQIDDAVVLGMGLRLEFEEFEIRPDGIRIRGVVASRHEPLPISPVPRHDAGPEELEAWHGPYPVHAWLVDDDDNRHRLPMNSLQAGINQRPDDDQWYRHPFASSATWQPDRAYRTLEVMLVERVTVYKPEWELRNVPVPLIEPEEPDDQQARLLLRAF